MTKGVLAEIFRTVESSRDEQVRFLCDLIGTPAVAPSSGGSGEWDKVELIGERARALGFSDMERFDARDRDAPSGARPNLVVWPRGKGEGRTGDSDAR